METQKDPTFTSGNEVFKHYIDNYRPKNEDEVGEEFPSVDELEQSLLASFKAKLDRLALRPRKPFRQQGSVVS